MTTHRDLRIHTIIVLHRQTLLIRRLNLVPTRGLGITRLIPVTRNLKEGTADTTQRAPRSGASITTADQVAILIFFGSGAGRVSTVLYNTVECFMCFMIYV